MQPDSEVILREEKKRLVESIKSLPEKYRIPLILRHYGDYKYDKIAEILNRKSSTVKSQVKKAIDLLRKKLLSEHPKKKFD